jgi:hypothetical protein
MRQVPDPDREEWIARLRERARLDADELVPRPGFGVYGLAAPALQPMALGECAQSGREWESIGLTYGNWAAPAGPWVMVTSSIGYAREPEAALFGAIDAEHARRADQDEEEPAEPPAYARAELTVGDHPVSALVARHGNVLAARLTAGPVTVTIVSRGVELDQLRLVAVNDLEPYLRGRSEMIGQMVEHHRNQPPPVLEPAEGIAAYRALVDASLDRHARLLAALRAHRTPRFTTEEAAKVGALWRRAARELSDQTGIGKRAADDIITSVVNQLTRLDEQAPWFTGDARLRGRAIDETLRHAVLDEPVPSRPAQQAWARYWAVKMSLASLAPDAHMRAVSADLEPRSEDWLAAWAAWAAED